MLVLVLEFSKISAPTLDCSSELDLRSLVERWGMSGPQGYQGHHSKERRSSKTEDESQPGWHSPDQITDARVRGIFRGETTTQPTSQHSTR